MRPQRREAMIDFLLEAAAEGGAKAFPAHALAGLRRVVPCGSVAYDEWNPQELLESSIAADEPQAWRHVWRAYPLVSQDDPIAGYPGSGREPNPLPDPDWLGRPVAISDFVSDREFRRRGLYAEICKPLDVRAVLKVFLPAGGATGAAFVFSTTSSRFTEDDRGILQRLIPCLVQVRRNAHARKTQLALADSAAAALLRRLTPRERVVLARAAAGETNTVIARALFVSPGTVRKHLEHIYDKLEVRNRTEAAAIYAQEQLAASFQATAHTPKNP